jgi:hypothetical protein
MKKSILGVVLLATSILTLSACSTPEQTKSSNSTSSTAVSESSTITTSSSEISSDTSETKEDRSLDEITKSLKSDTNKKITEEFLKNNLIMYNSTVEGPAELLPITDDGLTDLPIYESGMRFYTEKSDDSLIINVENYTSLDELNNAENYYKENAVDKILISKSTKYFSLMYTNPRIGKEEVDSKTFADYQNIFENIN